MQSTKLIKLTKTIEAQGKQIILNEYFTNRFSYILHTQSGKEMLYLRSENKMFRVDNEQKCLIALDNEKHRRAAEQMSKSFTESDIKSDAKEGKELYNIRCQGANIIVMADFLKTKDSRLKDTSYLASSEHQHQNSVAALLPLEDDEVILEGTINMNIQGNFIKTTFLVSDIVELEEDVTRFDKLLDYAIAA